MKFKNEVFAVGFNPRMGWLTGVAMNAEEAFNWWMEDGEKKTKKDEKQIALFD